MKKLAFILMVGFIITSTGCSATGGSDINVDSGLAAAENANAQIADSQAATYQANAGALSGAGDMSGAASAQALSDAATASADSSMANANAM
jgi:hypothetical protein